MPWYKQGLVSVALNSNAVIGTGTAFISNGRVGDAFRGPDGAWYEITNIASDTAMSISPNYQGATNAAGIYALAPMQGYVKDSADALRVLVNTYGTKLAALGSTGNYDVLPVNKGGTGATDQAGARSALGVVPTTSITDGTVGRYLRVGDFGLGVDSTAAAYEVGNLDATTLGVGDWRIGTNTTGTKPFNFGAVKVWRQSSGIICQLAQSFTTAQLAFRSYSSGAWAAWSYAAKAGANSDITSLSGLTTALSVAQGGTGKTTEQYWGAGNKLLNGNFSVNQRGYASGAATTAALQYTLDRWRVVTNGQNVALTPSGNGNKVTAPAGGLEQVIPGADMEGGVYTLSWVGAGTATVNGTTIANGGQTASLAAGANCTVRIFGDVERIQLELGTSKTPFGNRPYPLELMLCQWFYEEIETGGGAPAGFGVPANSYAPSTRPQAYILFKASKRVTPTIVFASPAGSRFVSSSGVYAAGPNIGFISKDGVGFELLTAPVASFGWFDQLGTIKVTAEILTSEYKLAPYGVKRLIDDAFIPADADNGDWEIYLAWLAAGGQSLPEVTEEEAAATKLGLDTAAEISWQAAEMSLIADQLLRIDDHDPTARPGSEEEWRAYRVKVRAWKEGAAHFPSPTYRPVQPS